MAQDKGEQGDAADAGADATNANKMSSSNVLEQTESSVDEQLSPNRDDGGSSDSDRDRD